MVWSRTALDDLASILEYVARHDGAERAGTLYESMRARIDTLTRLPRRGRVVPELKAMGLAEFRELLVAPYRVCFRIHERTVVLLGVLDGRRGLGELLLERALRLPEG